MDFLNNFNKDECSNLILTRRVNEGIIIDSNIRVSVTSGKGGQFKVMVNAPRGVVVFREELREPNATSSKP